ncbi:MAG: hypothetical protein MEFUS_02715 [Fusobacterium varium]
MKIKKYGNIYNNYTGIRLSLWEWLKRRFR